MKGTVLVTGASAGFGKACVERYVKEGYRVIATARRLERLEELRAQLGEAVLPLVLDVQDVVAVKKALSTLPDGWENVDILVNNAGLALGLEKAPEADFQNWQTMVNTNITGLLAVTHALLPGMVARGRGHVVNIGSIAGTYPYPGGNVYGATKAFVNHFSLNLRADLLGTPVRVTNIEPGMAETEFSLVRFKGDNKKAGDVYAGMQPLTAEDIAETVFWATALPAHVNVNKLEVMPVGQAFSPFAIFRS